MRLYKVGVIFMKKIFVSMAILLGLSGAVFAAENVVVDYKDTVKMQDKISNIGFKILNSNGIEKRTTFYLDSSRVVNAYSYHRNRQIVVNRGLYTMLDSDSELAAVLSHEISHSVDSYDGIFRGYFSSLNYVCAPKKYEYKADKRAIDYMVNSGYNPVAMIVVMNKVFPQNQPRGAKSQFPHGALRLR